MKLATKVLSMFERELDSKPNPKLHKAVVSKLSKIKGSADADFALTLLKGMNPKKLSQSDMDTLNDLNSKF